ncbi:hypothetical protein CD122_01070 [Staphylococcus rostri]|uniref:Gram-positive cocci surface proteins LPxTG domain-containing protein n=1 Tax=Staphylococcus rostri TaxID=522262 RepID=A0A2K3YWU5_9STAP|nr:MucBP domain-containing protein [Staphylococcus rostri]PNZ30083.1 hypothetical protein CD122_01070 [Staphylococcus rostri]
MSSHEGLSETPTIKNKDGTSIQFSFGDQPLHQGDYFYVETQDVPIALPRTFRIKSSETDGEGTVIANVERVSYESDFVKATDSEDPTRFDLKNDSTLTTMAIKYKVTFTEAVEGLKDVSATISGSGSKQTLAATVDRPTEFKVKINDKTVYTSVYTEPAWDDANSANFKRSHFNTGLEGVVTDQFGNRNEIEYDTGNREKLHAYLSMEATVYDYRSNTPGSDIGFLTETISEGLVVLSGQVGGMPDGFVTTVSSPTDPNKNTYTWDVDKLEIGQKLPVYYIPFQDIGTEEKHPNADNGKLYVTPDNMYYTIESISDDKRTITLKFHGDYTKPGRIVTSFKNPMEDFEQGKSSRLGINFDKDSFVDVGGSTDNSTITVSHPDGTPLSNFEMPNAKSLIYGDTKPDLVQQGEDGLTSRAVRLNYDATATGIPVETTNPEQINKGTVIVQYVDVNGNVLQQEKVDVADVDVDTDYDTVTDNRPQEITVGDKTYELVPAGDYTVGSVSDQGNLTTSKLRDVYASSDVNGVEPTGKVTQGTNYVTYVYKEKTAVVKEGTVTVNYKDEDGNVIKDPVVDTPASPVDTPYNTTDNRPEKITTEDGKTYQRVPEKTEGTEEGNVVEGTTEVTYVYKEVKGDVIVHYIDTEGNVIADDATDTPTTSTGTDYNTADDNKPNTITKDGVTYELVPALTKGNETGSVVEGTTEVTYVYKKVEAPVQPEPTPEAPTGDVIVHYVDEEGNTIADDKVDTQGSKIDTPYDTTDNRPERITTPDGKTYERVPEKTEGTETGSVVEGTTEVTYVYKEVKGDVIVHYIDTEGNVIADDAVDTPETSTGTDYNTADDNKPTTITKDGVKYELVPVLTKGNEQGKVVEGTTEITYVYKKVEDPTTPEVPNEDPGKYIPYIPVDPENPTDPNDPLNPPVDPNTGDPIDPIDYDETPEDPTDNPPIPDIDGYIPVDPKDPTQPLKPKDPNDPTKGYEPPKPVDPKEDTPVPYVPAGSITVHYVDEDGNVIKDPTVDTPKSPVGTEYNTNENGEEIPKEIIGKDGKVYVLVKVKDGDEETGKVGKGNKDVTYIYKLKEDPENPTTPEKPEEPNKPEQPKNPGNENPGNENPGDENPGNGNPDNGNPGNGNPGDGNPGNENPGNGNPGNGNPGMDQPSETMKDKDAKDMKQADKAMDKELPETGNTNNPFVTAFGFLTLLAGARLTRRKRREED